MLALKLKRNTDFGKNQIARSRGFAKRIARVATSTPRAETRRLKEPDKPRQKFKLGRMHFLFRRSHGEKRCAIDLWKCLLPT
jgi:hypothetical protein